MSAAAETPGDHGPERNFIGYGPTPPKIEWPNGARICVSVVINYEEGAEYSLLDGTRRESAGEVASPVPVHLRDLNMESMFEYGSRAGVWRLLRLLDRYEIPCTFFGSALALERNPHVAKAIAQRGDEPCGHGYRWEEYHDMPREQERERIRMTVESIQKSVGERPLGWFPRYGPSINSRELLAEAGFLYDNLAFNDDLPYYVTVNGKPWPVVPYSLELNDGRFFRGGLYSIESFEQYLRDGFDCLYAEGAETPKMMTVGLHCRIAGTPARSMALERFLAHAKSHPGVWFARRLDIARYWLERYPPK
ncbi:MAG: polysaccharide deacetylase family protein [Chloroflexi bacterium]|nr:polysaccharide deacetylase family protein [Chloroflexota bacterium]